MIYTLIENDEDIIKLIKYFDNNNITRIAMDFEGNFNLHAYGNKLCLIQIFDGKKYFVIDPFKIKNEEIIKFLRNKQIIKYMYGVESDFNLIYLEYGIFIKNVFDLKLIVDIFKLKNNSLNDVLKYYFFIEIKNKKKYQLYNWIKRPINEDAIQYALNDVAYLLKLNDYLMEEIKKNNKYEELIYKLIKKEYLPNNNKNSVIFKNEKFIKLSYENKIIFKSIYEIRENYAKKYNMPPFHIINNDVLFDIVNKNIKEIKISKKLPVTKQNELKEIIIKKLI